MMAFSSRATSGSYYWYQFVLTVLNKIMWFYFNIKSVKINGQDKCDVMCCTDNESCNPVITRFFQNNLPNISAVKEDFMKLDRLLKWCILGHTVKSFDAYNSWKADCNSSLSFTGFVRWTYCLTFMPQPKYSFLNIKDMVTVKRPVDIS